MKNIVSRKKLRNFWEKYPESEETLKTWYKVAMKADWTSSNNIKSQYRNASIVGNNRVVFNICGNKYRLIVKFNYEMQWAWIRFIGTHSDYDRINAAEI
jgi:mRNA interferase HigB